MLGLLMANATDPDDPVEIELCLPLIRDIRDFLLSDQPSEPLLEAVRLVHQAAQHLSDSPARAGMLAVFIDREAFARMVDAAIATQEVPDTLVEVLSVAPIDGIEALLQVLASRWSSAGQELGRQILAAAFGDRIRQLGDVIIAAPGPVAVELITIAADREPEFAVLLAVAMVRRNDRATRLVALEVLKVLPYRSEVGRALVEHGLTAKDPETCAKAAEVLEAKGEKRAFPAVARALQRGVEAGVRTSALEPLADALARLDPDRAVTQFTDWIRPEGLLQRARTAPGPMWQLSVRCLAKIPGQGARELLRWIHSRSEGDLKMRTIQAMAVQKELKRRD
jgi:hypothetical protein